MNHWLTPLIQQPGGWFPTFLREYPWSVAYDQIRKDQTIKIPIKPICVQLFFFVATPFLLGLHFIWAIYLIFILPVIFLLAMWAMRRRFFGDTPAVNACLFPKDESRDLSRRYGDLLLMVSTVWLTAIVVFFVCLLAMQLGMGEQWNPFTRTVKLESGDFLKIYELVEVFLFGGGFLAFSGLVWWPMYVFFEWLELRSKLRNPVASTNA